MKPYNQIISSVIANVGSGTSDPKDGPSQGSAFHKARIKISFKEFKYRMGVNTSDIMKELSASLGSYPGVILRVDKNREGPPCTRTWKGDTEKEARTLSINAFSAAEGT